MGIFCAPGRKFGCERGSTGDLAAQRRLTTKEEVFDEAFTGGINSSGRAFGKPFRCPFEDPIEFLLLMEGDPGFQGGASDPVVGLRLVFKNQKRHQVAVGGEVFRGFAKFGKIGQVGALGIFLRGIAGVLRKRHVPQVMAPGSCSGYEPATPPFGQGGGMFHSVTSQGKERLSLPVRVDGTGKVAGEALSDRGTVANQAGVRLPLEPGCFLFDLLQDVKGCSQLGIGNGDL